MIKTENLVYEYILRDEDGNPVEIKRAVDDVSLQIKKGEFIAILGNNGSGKSTLAKHLNALFYPAEGKVLVEGLDTSQDENMWTIREKVGMVFQNPDNQIVGTVVEEDVGFGLENMGIPTDTIWSRVDEALKKTGIIKHRKKSPNRLSGGQKQRVAIAGVLAMHPDCIILDEATAMLDPNGRKDVIEAAVNLNKKDGISIILITHYMEEVIHADRIFVMNKGKVVMQGTVREIFAQVDKIRTLGLDVPEITALAYELEKSGVKLPRPVLTREELVEALLCH